MKIKKIIAPVLVMVLLQSCGSTKQTVEETFWVSGVKTNCNSGAGKSKCLHVYKGEDLNNATWENFYAPIEGFTFEEGMLQKINVSVEELDKEKLPQDVSSLKYSLIKVLEKREDKRIFLTGKWVVKRINNAPLNRMISLPTMQINSEENVISGNTGCNSYSARITNVNEKTIAISPVAMTKKMCINKNAEKDFGVALSSIKTYTVTKSSLNFYNSKGEEVLAFMKNDITAVDSRINDIWIATSIDGAPINRKVPAPRLEIHLSKMLVMGNNGCNEYSGEIQNITKKEINLGKIAVAQKMCRDMTIADRYNKALAKVTTYQIKEGILKLYDSNEKEVISFLKID